MKRIYPDHFDEMLEDLKRLDSNIWIEEDAIPIVDEATEMPIDTLKEIIGYLEDTYNGLQDIEGTSNNVAKYIHFLEKVVELYIKCEGCGRLISPDEEHVVVDEDVYCNECYESLCA